MDKTQEIREALSKYLMNEFQPSDNPAELLQQFGIIKEFQRKAPEWLSYLLTELDAAKQENERLKRQREFAIRANHVIARKRRQLQQRLKQAEEALEWYADKKTYKWNENEDDPFETPTCDVLDDGGQLARMTLSLIRGEANMKKSSTAASLLKYSGTWEGDDLEELLDEANKEGIQDG
jgi:hypothetical protein